MKLATSAQVLARLNTTVVATTAVDSALEAATPIIENVIGTPLQENTRIDWFSYILGDYSSNPQFISLYLNQGYVQPGIQVYLSTDGYPVTQTFSNAEATTYVTVDFTLGIVNLYIPPLQGIDTIAVAYTAGFADQSTEIPQYLREASISACIRFMHAHKIAHNKDDVPAMAGEYYRLMYTQLNSYVRPRHNGYAPSRSFVYA